MRGKWTDVTKGETAPDSQRQRTTPKHVILEGNVIMVDPCELREGASGPAVLDTRERDHTRRDAVQEELLRRVLRRLQHQAHIDRALLRVRQQIGDR